MDTAYYLFGESEEDDDEWRPELFPVAREIPVPMQRKIRKFESEVGRGYDRHVSHTDKIHSIGNVTDQHFIGLDPTRNQRFDDFAAFSHDQGKRALKGILKTKQELEDEKKEAAQRKARFMAQYMDQVTNMIVGGDSEDDGETQSQVSYDASVGHGGY